LSTVSLGLAAASIFFWAVRIANVFVAPIHGEGLSLCACYYRVPDITALVALSTPFALFCVFFGRVQMQGLAALFGDYLTYQKYTIPHFLGRQSFLWTWGMLCSPKMAGTIVGTRREKFAPAQWRILSTLQGALYYMSLALQLCVALTASSFMIRFKELLISVYLHDNMTPLVNSFIKYVLLPLPSVLTLCIGVYAAHEVYTMTIGTDAGETFGDQLKTIVPGCMHHTCVPSRHSSCENILASLTLVVGWLLIMLCTFAVAHGLCPDLDFLFGSGKLESPKLVQAELWGACGFVFFALHIPRVLAIAFSTWDDMESLKHLAHLGHNPKEM
jgi:hypothetical protein